MSKTLKTKSALSYFGSDSEVAADIAAMFDDCNHVTIPFCGGLSILPHLKARAIVANDLHAFAINFYRMMSSGHKDTLIHMCQKTLSHPWEMEHAQDLLRDGLGSDKLVQAWAFWAVCWLGRKGKGGTKHMGGMPSIRRTATGGTNASRIRAAANDLHEWARQFERCEWECVSYDELMPKIADRPENGVYCDPPWVGAGRNYLHSFTIDDHLRLRDHAGSFLRAKVVIRYDDTEFIRDTYRGWNIIEAESRTQSNAVKGEVWITNR